MKLSLIIVLLFALFSRKVQAQDFSFAQAGDFHAGSACWKTNFQTLVKFILAHTNDGILNIKGLISTGDLYEQNTNVYNPGSFGYSADRLTYVDLTNGLHQLRTNGVCVWLCGGNHDCDSDGLQDWCTTFHAPLAWNNVFPVSFFSNQVGFLGTRVAGDSRNVIMSYTNGSVKILFVNYTSHFTNSLNFFPEITPAAAILDQTQWITNVAAQYRDHNVIVAAHYALAFSLGAQIESRSAPYFAYDDGTGYQRIGPGPAPFSQGFRDVPNLLFYLSGHTRSLYKGHITVQASDGHFIDVQCVNTQKSQRNSLLVNILTFKKSRGIVQVSSYDAVTRLEVTNNSIAWTQSIFGGGTQAYQHNWTIPLAVPRQKKLFGLVQ
jgi:hypothetical protein